jgi:hypothetical protein
MPWGYTAKDGECIITGQVGPINNLVFRSKREPKYSLWCRTCSIIIANSTKLKLIDGHHYLCTNRTVKIGKKDFEEHLVKSYEVAEEELGKKLGFILELEEKS